MPGEHIQSMQCNLNDKENQNIIQQLLEKDLTEICFKIFSYLDSTSFSNCRFVCHEWRDFIDHQFYELPKGKKWRNDKLMSNIFNKDFIPKEDKISFNEKEWLIANVVADQSNILISMFNVHEDSDRDGDLIFCLSSYELHSLKLAWSLKLKYVDKNDRRHTYLCLNNDRVYATVFQSVFIIDRVRGNVLNTINRPIVICGLACMENRLLALAYGDQIKIFNIENVDKPRHIFHSPKKEMIGVDLKLKSDGNKLISLYSEINQWIIASDFNSGNKLGEIQIPFSTPINDINVFWPYIICVFYTTSEDEESKRGIRIFDMEKEIVLKDILWQLPITPIRIEIKNKFIIVRENHRHKKIHTKRFLNYEDLFGNVLSSIEDLSSRQVEELHFHKNIMAGNSVLTIFKSYLLKRSYWISKSKTEIYKSKNDKSDAEEGTNRKKRKIN